MPIRQFSVSGLRNLKPLTISPHPNVNFIYGANGSGKTSILEAIALLASGKSFRTHQMKHVLAFESDRIETRSEVIDPKLGDGQIDCLRTRQGDTLLKMNGSVLTNQAEAAHWLPVQVIDPTTFRLLAGSPEDRRSFIDWGVFHVEHTFMDCWKRFKQQLKQRNSVLKQQDHEWLSIWTEGFIEAAEQVNEYRQSYIKRFLPVFYQYLERMDNSFEVSIQYYPGWDKTLTLTQALEKQHDRDLQVGFTQSGPHRAELRIKVGKLPAVEVLSRGQQKTVVAALKLAQGSLFQQESERAPIYLVDDLASELDEKHRFALCRLLEELNCQTFITSIEKDKMTDVWKPESSKVFHVEHGGLSEDNS